MLNKIIKPKKVAKYLVAISDSKLLRYYFGYYGIYVDAIRPLLNSRNKLNSPTIVTIFYEDEDQLKYFEKYAVKDISLHRIFKSMSVKRNDKTGKRIEAFAHNSVRNLVNLVKGKRIRVVCKESKDLQDYFYKMFLDINEKEGTNCKFDYDSYDVTFRVREYFNDYGYSIVSFVEGL